MELELLQAETKSLTKQHQNIQTIKILVKERFDNLSKKDTFKSDLDNDTLMLSQGA